MRILPHKELHAACVKIGHIIFGRRASFNKMHVRAFINYYKRMLKLSRAGSIESRRALGLEVMGCDYFAKSGLVMWRFSCFLGMGVGSPLVSSALILAIESCWSL